MGNIKSISICVIGEYHVSTIKSMKIGDFCRKEIMKNVPSEKIIAKANKRPDGKKVNSKHIAWYVWDMRKDSSNHYTENLPSNYVK